MLGLPLLSSLTKSLSAAREIKSSSSSSFSSRFCEKFRETRVETRPFILGSASNALAERRTFRSRVVLLRTRLRFARDYVLVGPERNRRKKLRVSIIYIYIYIFSSTFFSSLFFYYFFLFSHKLISSNYEITTFPIRNRDPGTLHGFEIFELSIIYYNGVKRKKKKRKLFNRARSTREGRRKRRRRQAGVVGRRHGATLSIPPKW